MVARIEAILCTFFGALASLASFRNVLIWVVVIWAGTSVIENIRHRKYLRNFNEKIFVNEKNICAWPELIRLRIHSQITWWPPMLRSVVLIAAAVATEAFIPSGM